METSEISFTVYGRPVAKERPRVVDNHAVTPKKTKEWETTIGYTYKSVYHGFKFPREKALRVEADFYLAIPKNTSKKQREKMLSGEVRPAKRNGDVDNLTKTVLDSGNGVIFEDDAQVVELMGRKFYGEQERTVIRVTAL